MPTERRAVIDVGTNSVKLLVADVANRSVKPVIEKSRQTRLGTGFYQTRHLLPGPIAATAQAVAAFVVEARDFQAHSIRAIATSAAREAINADELTSAIERASGLRVCIISGDEEANLVFQGVSTDPGLVNQRLLLADVGGGSTEFILGDKGQQLFRASFPLGSVRLLESQPRRDPPTADELTSCRDGINSFLRAEVRPLLGTAFSHAESDGKGRLLLVGTGGTASILARMEAGLEEYNRAQIEATRLDSSCVSLHVERLWRLPLIERQKVVGLPPNRADVILGGAAIYEAIMTEFGFAELRVSTRGLRFAAVISGMNSPACS
jgi:exopolyphosphatase/guanosine-5'-triphosphate,3'-diphosphate pyrophosphatase